jgi:membrane protein YdbS with pleckstrin-like domain
MKDESNNNENAAANESLKDAILLKLAQRRVKEKRFITKSIALFVAILIAVLLLSISNPFGDVMFGFVWGAFTVWGFYILYRVAKVFVIPLVKNYKTPLNYDVDAEYEKLKKMPADVLASEYEKLQG